MAKRFRQEPRAAERPLRHARRRRSSSVLGLVLALMLVALIAGIVVGLVIYPMIPFPWKAAPLPTLPEQVRVSEDDLGAKLGSYRIGAETKVVTVRDAILESRSLEAARGADGTYQVPSADAVLAIARNEILVRACDEGGITVSPEEVDAYAQRIIGTTDFAEISAVYEMDEPQARAAMERSARIEKLRNTVVAIQEQALPEPPPAPQDGAQDVMLAEYGTYVTQLLGSEWDVAANMWATEDGPFRKGLTDYTITNDGATYSAAQAAYQIACAQVAEANAQASAAWTDYVNQRMSQATVELESLVI